MLFSLQPTLWRTCRVLANRARLRVLGCVIQHPDLTVSDVAAYLELGVSATSQYLRALEARGLLTSRHVGRHVRYRAKAHTTVSMAPSLLVALKLTFHQQSYPVETAFKLATAFTHPRRIEIFHAIGEKRRTLAQLYSLTGIPSRALQRHLRKLEARELLARWRGTWAIVNRTDPLGVALTRLAGEGRPRKAIRYTL